MHIRLIVARLRLMAAGLLAMPVAAHADIHVDLLDTFPAGEVVHLAQGQSYYVHLRCSADRPARIWVRPAWHDRIAAAGTNGLLPCSAGGETLGVFFLMSDDAVVDGIEVLTDETSRSGTVALRIPVSVSRATSPGTPEPEPEWIARLQAEARMRRASGSATTEQPASWPASIAFAVVMALLCALAVLGFVLPVRAWRTWDGAWRRAALLPLGLMALLLLRLIVGVAIDPTSHNLWPFEIAGTGGLSVATMLVLHWLRRIANRDTDPPAR